MTTTFNKSMVRHVTSNGWIYTAYKTYQGRWSYERTSPTGETEYLKLHAEPNQLRYLAEKHEPKQLEIA